ncbi:MAG: 30S ribosomal protein S18 [Candidatus Omnitrophica bacterium]|nr:30S ribosomal protein S18 [Candidatus Omnitrophota bacterium]
MPKKREKTSKKRFFKKKPCRLCREKTEKVDFKDIDLLSKYISDRGKILPTRLSGNCAKHQRMIANAIKKARLAALLPFVKVRAGLRGRGRR